MRKFFKLLCYSLITVFLLGFGGEKVLAAFNLQSFKAVEGGQSERWIQFKNPSTGRDWWSAIKYRNDNNAYVFCLDSNKYIYTQGNMSLISAPGVLARSYNSGYERIIEKILIRAYLLGFDENSQTVNFELKGKSYSISRKDFYGIVQSAVWYAAHGTSTDGGYYGFYEQWISSNEYSNIFEYLTSTENISYSISFSYNGENNIPSGTLKVDGAYLVSGAYTVNTDLPNGVTFKANLSSGASEFAMKIDDGEWFAPGNAGVTISRGQVLRFRVKTPEGNAGQVGLSLSLTSTDYVTAVNLYKYYPEGDNNASNNKQNLIYPEKVFGNKSTTLSLNGNYDNPGTIKMAKVTHDPRSNDPEVMIKVPGATLELYKSSNPSNVLYTFTSTDDYVTYTVPFEDGVEYCIRETQAPSGFVLNRTKTKCDTFNLSENKNVLELELENVEHRVKYRKVDQEGNPIAGVRIELYDYVGDKVGGDDSLHYICGITDRQGYLTIACPEADPSNENYESRIISPDADGTFGLYYGDFRNPNGLFYPIDRREPDNIIYSVKEYFEDGINSDFYNPLLDGTYPVFGFYFDEDYIVNGFGHSAGSLKFIKLLDENGKEVTNMDETPVVTVQFKNFRYLKFTKTDTGTGEEIAGAEMLLEDISEEEYCTGVPLGTPVAKWVSKKDEPYYYQGAVIGHKYRLTELTPPKDHVQLQTSIEFEIDENGKVVLSESTPTQVKLSTDPNVDLGRWIIVGNDMVVNPPNTGISLINKIAVGSLLVFVGYEVIKFRKMKANS